MSDFIVRVYFRKQRYAFKFDIEENTQKAFEGAAPGRSDVEILTESICERISAGVGTHLAPEHVERVKRAVRPLFDPNPRPRELSLDLDGTAGEFKVQSKAKTSPVPAPPEVSIPRASARAEEGPLLQSNSRYEAETAQLRKLAKEHLDELKQARDHLKEQNIQLKKLRSNLASLQKGHEQAKQDVSAFKEKYDRETQRTAQMQAERKVWKEEFDARTKLQKENEELKQELEKLKQAQETVPDAERATGLASLATDLLNQYSDLSGRWQECLNKFKGESERTPELQEKLRAWRQQAKEIETAYHEVQNLKEETSRLGRLPSREQRLSAATRIQRHLTELKATLDQLSLRSLHECEGETLPPDILPPGPKEDPWEKAFKRKGA